jgi:iron complex outermembrane receptor protein
MRIRLLLWLLFWTWLAAPRPAAADDGPQRKRPIGIEELTITARNRDGALQELPQSVSAIAGSELRDLDVRQLHDLDGLVPNLGVAETSRAGRISVRGIGSGGSLASGDPGVGVYLDGVYLARAEAGLLALPDIERVEVLRGPQGTRFGKNTIGGAVNVITSKPTLDGFASAAEVRVGSGERVDARLSANVPLVAERAAARVSLATARRERAEAEKLLALRTQLLATPSESLELVLSLDASRESAEPRAAEPASHMDPARSFGASLTTSLGLGESHTLRSISAWRRQSMEQGQRQLSQELQLSGEALEGRLQYLTGLFWLEEEAREEGLRGLDRLEGERSTHAVYGQSSYDLTERLSATVGARLSAERRRSDSGSTRSNHVSPLATLKYELGASAHVYGTWSRGFRSGAMPEALDDEELTSYEVGFKSLFLDNRLRLNAALFHSSYDEIQLAASTRAELDGAELEIRAVPCPGLELSSTLVLNRADSTRLDLPAHSMTLGASYQIPLRTLGDLRLRGGWTRRGKLDAQLAWMLPDGLTEIVLSVAHIPSETPDTDTPRSYGLELRRTF